MICQAQFPITLMVSLTCVATLMITYTALVAAIARDDRFWKAYLCRACARSNTDDIPAALQDYSACLEIVPHDLAFTGRGCIYLSQSKWEEVASISIFSVTVAHLHVNGRHVTTFPPLCSSRALAVHHLASQKHWRIWVILVQR